ncbi:unnamed protein product [Alopecurus aequalis]
MSLVSDPEPSDLRICKQSSTAGAEDRGGETRSSSLCVGLIDPVSNLVIDSLISYKKPTRKRGREPCEQEEDLERRSLDGMVAFLTRMLADLAERQAVRYLVLADADALVAARVVVSDAGMRRFHDSGPAIMEMALLKCAALAAPRPPRRRLAQHLRPHGRRPRPARQKVNALLNAYEQMPNGDPEFELHTICGVNDRVLCLTSDAPPGHHHTHVNFMATPKSPCGSGVPTLFFAEIRYGYEDRHVLLLPCARASAMCWMLNISLSPTSGATWAGLIYGRMRL